jgi:hypothetical protein
MVMGPMEPILWGIPHSTYPKLMLISAIIAAFTYLIIHVIKRKETTSKEDLLKFLIGFIIILIMLIIWTQYWYSQIVY